MATTGRWGITRDEKGELALIWAWPWYWRYPFALAITAVCLWVGFSGHQKSDWLAAAMLIGGPLVSLTIAYEIGLLCAAATVIWALWLTSTILLPSTRGGSIPVEVWLWALAAFAYYAWRTGADAKREAKLNELMIERLWQRVNQLEERAQAAQAETWREVPD